MPGLILTTDILEEAKTGIMSEKRKVKYNCLVLPPILGSSCLLVFAICRGMWALTRGRDKYLLDCLNTGLIGLKFCFICVLFPGGEIQLL